MRTIISTIIALLFIQSISAQNDSTISFVAYWNKGDIKNYRITKKKIQILNDEETKNQTTTYDVKFTVADSTSTNYTIEWEYENTVLSNVEIPQEFRESLEKYKVIKVVYTTDEYGTFLEVINWKEIRDLMYELFDMMPDMISDKSIDVSETLKPIRDIYSSQEGIASLVLKEIQIFHYPMGLVFNAYDTVDYEEYLPNMLGGDPIKGNGRFYFKSIDSENNKCEFIYKLELDSADAKKLVLDLMNAVLNNTEYKSKKDKKKDIDEMILEFSKMSMDIKDENIFSYYNYPGWPINIHTKRTSRITTKDGIAYRIDEIIIEEKE